MKTIVLITGCSTGIGRALVREYAKQGCLIYATARKLEAIRNLAGENVFIDTLDVTNDHDVQSVMQRIKNEQGRLDILVNNAGYAAIGPVVEIPAAELRRQFDVNVFSVMALVQNALPLLLKSANAKIVNVGSVSGVLTTPFAGAYCAAKASLHKLSDALRMELAPFNIRVMIVQPGAIRSEFGKNSQQQLAQTLQQNSLYEPIRQRIYDRANASQQNPTPVETLAEKVAAKSLKKNPPAILRTGHGSHAMVALKRLLPEKQVDRLLGKIFKLNELRKNS